MFELHNAPLFKRLGAGMFDLILLAILAVGLCLLFNAVFGFDNYFNAYESSVAQYEKKYGVIFDIDSREYESFSNQQKEQWDFAYKSLIEDEKVVYNYNMTKNLAFCGLTLAIFFSYLILEFIIPLFFKNGMTIGKRLFNICLMSVNGVRVKNVQVFVRSMIGKYTIETMIPVYLVIMLLFNTIGGIGVIITAALGIFQVAVFCCTGGKKLIHDAFSQTYVVDYMTQSIFDSYDELIKAKEEYAAQQAKEREF